MKSQGLSGPSPTKSEHNMINTAKPPNQLNPSWTSGMGTTHLLNTSGATKQLSFLSSRLHVHAISLFFFCEFPDFWAMCVGKLLDLQSSSLKVPHHPCGCRDQTMNRYALPQSFWAYQDLDLWVAQRGGFSHMHPFPLRPWPRCPFLHIDLACHHKHQNGEGIHT